VTPAPTSPRAEPPAWYPPWARELGETYFSGTTCTFLLHGNVNDLVATPDEAGGGYLNLPEFLSTQVFGSWDVVLHYDLGQGPRVLAGRDAQRHAAMVGKLAARWGEPATWPRDPAAFFFWLDRVLERNLLEDDPAKRDSIAVIFNYVQFLVPEGDLATLSRGPGENLVRLLTWAQNPYFKRVNVAFCLIAERLAEVNDRLVQNPHVAGVAVPLPSQAERQAFIDWAVRSQEGPAGQSTPELAKLSNGLNLVNLQVLLGQGRVTPERFKQIKKSLIERQCQGLLEFIEPRHTLDLVVGLTAAKDRLRQDAELLANGHLEAAPMGYLICGPVGTGKTFLAECYAGSIGIPCVKLRNFRSKYVGETEGNLEQVLTVLRSLGPVVVIIDEADAALGNRQADGDSGTSSRVFAMIASQMGDTAYRGQIVWMLLTSRPDLLPIDLKRQGRAEVHIPLFYPQGREELAEMARVMARKNKVALAPGVEPDLPADRNLSGSDVEGIVLAAHRAALASGQAQVSAEELQLAAREFIPSAQGLEKELQEIAAVLECTQMQLLPAHWQARVAEPQGRSRLQERLVAIRQLLED
jgi:AAA+ superfamily predicted ATPase